MHIYTLQDVRATFGRIADLASTASKARELVNGARKTAGAAIVAVQSIAAQAVAQGLTAGLSEGLLRALYRESVPANGRKGVNLTQALACLIGVTKGTRTTGPHQDASKLLVEWAEGTFTTSPSAAYNVVRTARSADYSKMLSQAMAGLLAKGWTPADLRKAVNAFLRDYSKRQDDEAERFAAIQLERAQIVAEDTQEQEAEVVTA